jgi:hypothetical protein
MSTAQGIGNLPGTYAADFYMRTTSIGGVTMNLENGDIGAGIFLWSMISFLTTGLTVVSGWMIWG